MFQSRCDDLEHLAIPGVIPSRDVKCHCGGETGNEIWSPNEVFLSDCANVPWKLIAEVIYCDHGSESDHFGRTFLASWTGNDGHDRARGRDHGYGCGC